jgi:hypothetical protein
MRGGTKICVVCHERATHWTGHIHVDDGPCVSAGWCEKHSLWASGKHPNDAGITEVIRGLGPPISGCQGCFGVHPSLASTDRCDKLKPLEWRFS